MAFTLFNSQPGKEAGHAAGVRAVKAGTLTINAAAYLADPRIRALSQSLRAVLLEVRCAAVLRPEPGVLWFDLSDVAKMIGCGREQLQQLVDLGHIEGAPAGAVCSPLIHVDRRGTQHVLIPAAGGPVWWLRPCVVESFLRQRARDNGRRGQETRRAREPRQHRAGCGAPSRVSDTLQGTLEGARRGCAAPSGSGLVRPADAADTRRSVGHPSGCRPGFPLLRTSPFL